MIGTILLILTVIVISMQFINHWNLSHGRLHITYPLTIVILLTYMVIETTIALRDSVQYSMLLFNVINLWGIIMAVKGIRRLKRESNKNPKEMATNNE